MPRIRELAGLKNGRLGFCVDSQGATHGVYLETLKQYVSAHPTATPEILEKHLEEGILLSDSQVRVHCFSKEPLRFAFNVADKGVEIPENWWESP